VLGQLGSLTRHNSLVRKTFALDHWQTARCPLNALYPIKTVSAPASSPDRTAPA
jgi:hypothetical protein